MHSSPTIAVGTDAVYVGPGRPGMSRAIEENGKGNCTLYAILYHGHPGPLPVLHVEIIFWPCPGPSRSTTELEKV